ncbi:interferon-inducible GTPase 5-like [Plectropomus leopardus]|uniref:interferon-inducible GTPase 5-like n=1 Tax=Plectropomus leopardus TaxID=160734 RepID=UPI001C4D0799|nr:interferon-inducible GTPase 5-like [Plectropomus leopardus]
MGDPFDRELTEDIKKALESNNRALADKKIREYLDKENNTPLNIGITGESGSGKSSFVNAFRGINKQDEGAAPTGVTETTMEVTPYSHPNCPNVTLWDLPGIGTVSYPAKKYLKLVGFERFDFFIIISADRFRENDAKLAQEIKKMKKEFYFVRSKIDQNLRDEKESRSSEFNEQTTLSQIREYCIQSLKKQGVVSPQVFLVSNHHPHLYDFPLLLNTFERELPAHKRKALLMAMPNISLEVINKKKKAFDSKIKYLATLSAAVAAVPVPGLSAAVDISLLVGVVTRWVFGFGLDIPSLRRLAFYAHVPLDDLRDIIVSSLAAVDITPELVLRLLAEVGGAATLLAAEEVCRFIPILGIPASMALSFTFTYRALKTFLNMLAEDAQRVLERALGLNTSV